MRMTKNILTTLAAAGALGAATPLWAHAEVQRSTPAAQASVAAPRTVSVTFDDALVRQFSKLDLVMVGHNMHVTLRTTFSRDGKTMIGTPEGALMKGDYRLDWTAATPDGHRETGHIPFKVK